jgi:hypothetical protein
MFINQVYMNSYAFRMIPENFNTAQIRHPRCTHRPNITHCLDCVHANIGTFTRTLLEECGKKKRKQIANVNEM